MFKTILLTLFTFSTVFLADAHSRTEVGYRFIEMDTKTYLEVHLTSSTLFDLLYDLHPELKLRASLNLSHYTSDYEVYFNQHIKLILNDEEHLLTYTESNLIIHDATIKFLVKDFEDKIHSYDVSVSGFDFYRNPSFTLFFTTPSMTELCRLSMENNRCTGALQEIAQADETSPSWSWWLLLGVPPGWFLVWILKRRSMKTVTT